MEIMYECAGESTKEKVLAMTIEELGFSVRIFNCLKRVGLDTVEDLVQLTEDELYRVRNLGKNIIALAKHIFEERFNIFFFLLIFHKLVAYIFIYVAKSFNIIEFHLSFLNQTLKI